MAIGQHDVDQARIRRRDIEIQMIGRERYAHSVQETWNDDPDTLLVAGNSTRRWHAETSRQVAMFLANPGGYMLGDGTFANETLLDDLRRFQWLGTLCQLLKCSWTL
jgi:hypothetical protein